MRFTKNVVGVVMAWDERPEPFSSEELTLLLSERAVGRWLSPVAPLCGGLGSRQLPDPRMYLLPMAEQRGCRRAWSPCCNSDLEICVSHKCASSVS